ncbi:MAG: hypothetical protein PHY63_06175 [Candidatus Cloacimonetes bacterium]|nr:hypothetical protein [Candidatus Cloacimonadota bacterium]
MRVKAVKVTFRENKVFTVPPPYLYLYESQHSFAFYDVVLY